MGERDWWVIKTNRFGDTLWTRTYGDVWNDQATCVIENHKGNYVVTGCVDSDAGLFCDARLIEFDSLGNTIRARIYGGDNDMYMASSIRETMDHGYIIVGMTDPRDSGDTNAWIVRTDSLGDTLWTRAYGGTESDQAHSVQQTADSGFLVVGATSSYGEAVSSAWIIRTDSIGDTLWTRAYAKGTSNGARCVDITLDGSYVVVGDAYCNPRGSDGWLLIVNSLGDTSWTRLFGGDKYDFLYSVSCTRDGGYILAGETSSFGETSGDMWVIKTDSLGRYGVSEQENHGHDRQFHLITGQPNPFCSSVTIRYRLASQGHVSVELYDGAGRFVRLLEGSQMKPGHYSVVWDGKNAAGTQSGSGVYFVVIRTPGSTESAKLLKF
jgi:hypothetical protein